MQAVHHSIETQRYARCIEASRRVRWDIERDVIRGRRLDARHTFLPEGLSLADELPFLDPDERRLLSQVQGRTYANMFGVVERFVGAKMLEMSRGHALGDQAAMEALVRFTDEELKHQELFRRIERLAAERMPAGYRFDVARNEVAAFVLGKRTWAVLALTCHIELVTLVHYRASIGVDDDVSPLFRDVFLFHWKEESQHAVLDELEWLREDAALASDTERDAAVDDLIALVGGVDGLLREQSRCDAAYFISATGMAPDGARAARVRDSMLKAYRWQYIVSGAMEPRFQAVLASLTSAPQLQRIESALEPLMYAIPSNRALSQALAA